MLGNQFEKHLERIELFAKCMLVRIMYIFFLCFHLLFVTRQGFCYQMCVGRRNPEDCLRSWARQVRGRPLCLMYWQGSSWLLPGCTYRDTWILTDCQCQAKVISKSVRTLFDLGFSRIVSVPPPPHCIATLESELVMFFHQLGSLYCRVAYLRQEDLFFSQLTVRETLLLAAELQLPQTWLAEKKDKYVSSILFRLGLVSI